jgi:hypothetical protein
LLATRYRVEVRDKEGKPVTVLEDDSRSFTMNFIKLLIASHYNQNDVPTFSVYVVFGDSFYTGYIQTPYAGVPWQIFNLDPDQWASSTLFVPAIWLGTSPCANPALANGPCGSLVACCTTRYFPFSPYNVGPSALCYGLASCSPSLTKEGWAVTITNQWLNMSSSPVTIASMALVFVVPVTALAETSFLGAHAVPQSLVTTTGPSGAQLLMIILAPYAAIVDNLSTPVTVWPGYLITVSYTIYFPV